MIGIPDAITLTLSSPFAGASPCPTTEVVFDLSMCTPSWDKHIDFIFVLLKVMMTVCIFLC